MQKINVKSCLVCVCLICSGNNGSHTDGHGNNEQYAEGMTFVFEQNKVERNNIFQKETNEKFKHNAGCIETKAFRSLVVRFFHRSISSI